MDNDRLERELTRRLKLVEREDYEGKPLKTGDYLLLFAVGVVLPFLLMGYGWLI